MQIPPEIKDPVVIPDRGHAGISHSPTAFEVMGLGQYCL